MIFLRKAFSLLLLHAMLLPTTGCRWAPPAPQTTIPPTATHFDDAELRAIVLPQNIPASLPPAPADPEPRFYLHTITKQGETLFAIARWYTGKGANWKKLMDANPELNPLCIGIGATIQIPAQLLITRAPIPKSALASRLRLKNGSPRPAQTTRPVELPPLFGPIENAPSADEGTALPHPLQRLDE